VAFAQRPDHARHGLGAAGGHGDLLRLVGGIGDPDPTSRRQQIAVEVVDRENADFNGLRGFDWLRRLIWLHRLGGGLGDGLRRRVWGDRGRQRQHTSHQQRTGSIYGEATHH